MSIIGGNLVDWFGNKMNPIINLNKHYGNTINRRKS